LTDRATLGWHSTGGSQPSIDGVDVSIDGSQSIIRCVLEGTPSNKRICGGRPFAEEMGSLTVELEAELSHHLSLEVIEK
jgi:hypothetical protein